MYQRIYKNTVIKPNSPTSEKQINISLQKSLNSTTNKDAVITSLSYIAKQLNNVSLSTQNVLKIQKRQRKINSFYEGNLYNKSMNNNNYNFNDLIKPVQNLKIKNEIKFKIINNNISQAKKIAELEKENTSMKENIKFLLNQIKKYQKSDGIIEINNNINGNNDNIKEITLLKEEIKKYKKQIFDLTKEITNLKEFMSKTSNININEEKKIYYRAKPNLHPKIPIPIEQKKIIIHKKINSQSFVNSSFPKQSNTCTCISNNNNHKNRIIETKNVYNNVYNKLVNQAHKINDCNNNTEKYKVIKTDGNKKLIHLYHKKNLSLTESIYNNIFSNINNENKQNFYTISKNNNTFKFK